MAGKAKVLVVAVKQRVWYDNVMRYPIGDDEEEKAGIPFYVHERSFKRDKEGKILLKDGQPILPRWAKRCTPEQIQRFEEAQADEEARQKRSMVRKGPKKSSGDEDVI